MGLSLVMGYVESLATVVIDSTGTPALQLSWDISCCLSSREDIDVSHWE